MDPMAVAEAAAAASAVVVRPLSEPVEHAAAQDLFVDLWGADPIHPPVSADLLAALAYFGGYVAGAYSGETLVGALAGFRGSDRTGEAERSLHSHIAGVRPQWQGRRVGHALKLHQRAWALDCGITTINWTFDPLVRRNAYFNITRLGARPQRYVRDFYGEMRDGVNAGQGSDRLLVSWPLRAEHVVRAAEGSWSEPDVEELLADGVVLGVSADGGPERHLPAGGAHPREGPLLVGVPADIVALRRREPALARAWRSAVRETLGGLMAAGHPVMGVTRSGWYVLAAR